MAVPTQHARLAPSSAHRWLACPFSLRAPETPPGPAAIKGTKLHKLAAAVILGECELDDVPEPDQPGLAIYRDHIHANQCTPLVERYWESILIPDFAGTIDCLLVRDGMCAVYDFKSGRWPVRAPGNPQLLCYAALAAEHFEVDTFFGVIVQPKVSTTPDQAQFSLQEVTEHRERVAAASQSDAKGTGDHCRFCSLRTTGQCVEGAIEAANRGWR